MSLIHNERTKLTATYLNGVAVALFAVGAISPVISVMNAPSTTASPSVAAVAAICIASSLALHYLARVILGRLRP